MIRALLVDDEQPARDRLRGLLEDFDDVEVVGEARDGEQAIQRTGEVHPDLIFLDIQMPGLTGLDVAASLPPPRPRIVFCTAFDQYAIDAFEHHATDYLLKPVSRRRLSRAVQRVRAAVQEQLLQREVAEATATQARLMPQTLPSIAGLDYSGVCRAVRGVGGDYYDFLPIGGGCLGLAVGDVSGKGLYAGILVAGLQGRIQSIAPHYRDSIGTLVGEVNRLMCSSTDSNRYATFFYGRYDSATRELRYVNAGHNPPLLLRPDPDRRQQRVDRLEASGTVIGMLPEASYDETTKQLAPGDILLIYTDGLTEASNRQEQEFGEQQLEAVVREHAARPAAEIRDAVLREVDRFVGDAPPLDDMTLVIAKVM
jgi:sigma-B regulation protein RsbU (phosphoserine phosphatase)